MRKPLNRNLVIATSVVVFHVAVLWAMQNGLLRRAAEIVVPAEILTRITRSIRPSSRRPSPSPPAKPCPGSPPRPFFAVREPVPQTRTQRAQPRVLTATPRRRVRAARTTAPRA